MTKIDVTVVNKLYRSHDEADAVAEVEWDFWSMPEELTLPTQEAPYQCDLRRINRPPGEFTRTKKEFRRVQRAWATLRTSQNWKLERPMMITGKYYVKQVVL